MRAPGARLVVLASGNGSNLQALLDACRDGRLAAAVVGVVSDRPRAHALERARAAGVRAVARPGPRRGLGAAAREAYDAELASVVACFRPDLVVLAGWMRVLTSAFLDRFPGRVVNLHPALPGTFPGLRAVERAWEAARRGELDHTGVMVHFAVPEVDAGPTIATARVPLDPDEPLEGLLARVHAVEHRLLVDAVAEVCHRLTPSASGASPMPQRRALLSVHDKTGLIDLARGLAGLGFELIASGGTARSLAAADLPVTEVAEVTGSPEVLGGRVKTLHPAIHAGILSRRSAADDAELARQGYGPIDLVVCNLYPFEATVASEGVSEADAIEQIDIGGVTLLRAAAKNHAHVTVVSDPADYDAVLEALAGGGPLVELNRRLAVAAFRHTARYDRAISRWLDGGEGLELDLVKVADLRYGENPHQGAALYRARGAAPAFEQLGGKELSYNNLVDLDAARAIVADFGRPTVAIVKHTNPCGLASADGLPAAFAAALAGDPVSAFGSVIAVNGEVDLALVEAIGRLFVEVLVAPAFAPEALAALRAKKPACRLIAASTGVDRSIAVRSIFAGVLAQDADVAQVDVDAWRVATRRAPSEAEREALAFAWRAVKHVKSNAIVLARGEQLVGVGAGQMSRVDAVELAVRRAGERVDGAVLASDAFFPFPDGVEAAAAAGVRAVVQPGGSVKDAEVIAAADRLGLAMMLTGVRHFRH